jgi:uncharacterized protein YkwD
MTRLILVGMILALSACSDDDTSGADAAPGTPDAAPGTPDAAPGTPDAAPGECTLGASRCAWLAAHNAVRCAVDPPAAAMPAVTWDDALECVAQQYVNTCPTGHNEARSEMYATCGGSGYVGENMAWGYPDEAAVVAGWAEESADYDLAGNACSGVCGHYTQIVWAATLRIGCASPTVSCGGTWGDAIYVCDYAPGGNYNGQAPYTAGSGPNEACAAR